MFAANLISKKKEEQKNGKIFYTVFRLLFQNLCVNTPTGELTFKSDI